MLGVTDAQPRRVVGSRGFDPIDRTKLGLVEALHLRIEVDLLAHARWSGDRFVKQYPARIQIDSPGGFPKGVTAENILDRSLPRNRRLADALARCGLVERTGQGADPMFSAAGARSRGRGEGAPRRREAAARGGLERDFKERRPRADSRVEGVLATGSGEPRSIFLSAEGAGPIDRMRFPRRTRPPRWRGRSLRAG